MTAPEKDDSESNRPRDRGAGKGPYVVGIGASAGGLDALKTFFGTVPARAGLSFVVVLHLAPDYESRIVELLQPYTRLRVSKIDDSTAIEPDRIYVIPPNTNLDAIDTHLRLSKLEEERNARAPIDHFFRTLALTHDGNAVGVVLTGAGSDGSLGIRQIKEHGGLTISQDPVEAEYDGMPRSAIETGAVDLVLPLREISEQIVRFCSTQPELPLPDDDREIDGRSRVLLDEILAQVRLVTGHELAVYKRALVLRRIRRRMQLQHVATLADYLDIIRAQPRETRALASDLMLIVTEFFRGKNLYGAIERLVIPHLFDVKSRADDKIRAWSIGCATGEEAYSLAMLMLEERERRTPQPLVQIFASDMSDDMLKRARAGVYPHEIVETVSPARLQRFFDNVDDHYRVRPQLRDAIVFSSHDLYRDPPFAHLDLIVCRGLLSELQPMVRRGVLNVFAYVLEPHGQLVVSSEDPVEDSPLFVPDHEAEGVRVFRLADGGRPLLAAHPPAFWSRHALSGGARRWPGAPAPSPAEIHAQLVAKRMPASVLVDDRNHVIHYSGSASRYLRLPGGEVTHELTRLVGRPVRGVLHDLLAAARRDAKSVSSGPVTFETDHGPITAVVRADPAGADAPPGVVLLLFDENPPATTAAPPKTPATSAISNEAAYRIRQLESDLDRANEQLHGLLAHASMRGAAAPLDVTSAHAADELVGTLGELESSRKELQSLNNELQRLDRENNLRLQELAKLSVDLKRLLESTGIATLFLDRDLKILRFTPEMRGIFNLTDADRGRPLADLRHGLNYETLDADAARVLEHLAPVEREVEGAGGRCFLSRLLPYRSTPYSIDGVVLTLVDITNAKRAEQELRDRDRRKDEFLALLAHELRNPLAPIITGVEVLRRTAGTGAMTEPIIATIARQAKLLVRLVDDLLDVSRVTGGRLRLRLAPVKLADVVHDALASVRPLIDSAQHELVVQVTDEPIVLKADAARLTQVLANLLNNAARYTPHGGLIELSAEREGDQAVIKVRDNGYGIPPQSVPHVFEMFYQGEDPRTARQSGLGIGLTLARSLVEMHGGTILAESGGTDRGSVFTLRLPIPADLPAVVAAPKDRTTTISGHRVLIVDDNADAARTLETLIHTLGDNDVHVELSGAAALAMVVDFRPDIVIVDLKMPEMDGYEVARRLRAQPGGNDILLVALTGWALDEHKRRSQAAGFDHHLTKPADRESLESLLAGSRPRPRLPLAEAPKTLH